MKKVLTGIGVTLGMFLILVAAIFAFLSILEPPEQPESMAEVAESSNDRSLTTRIIQHMEAQRDSLKGVVDSLKIKLAFSKLSVDSLVDRVEFKDGLVDGYKQSLERMKDELLNDEAKEEGIKNLAKTFESMKVEEMRPILANVDDESVMAIYRHTNARKRKNVLMALSGKRASRITQRLANGDTGTKQIDNEEYADSLSPPTPTGKEDGGSASIAEPEGESNGYRVQLASGTDKGHAYRVKELAGEKLNVPVYVVAREPYFKVRAGDFTERGSAEQLLLLAQRNGYEDAWVVRTKVEIAEESPMIADKLSE